MNSHAIVRTWYGSGASWKGCDGKVCALMRGDWKLMCRFVGANNSGKRVFFLVGVYTTLKHMSSSKKLYVIAAAKLCWQIIVFAEKHPVL